MLIYVVSDSHGEVDGFLNRIKDMEKPDKIFFLGDYTEDIEEIREALGSIEIIAVRGNNDFLDEFHKDELFFELEGHKIFLSHGHLYDINFDISNLYYRALELGADLVFFGHTHKPTKVEENGIILLNPGSPSFPRSRSRQKTFIKLRLENGIKYEFVEIK